MHAKAICTIWKRYALANMYFLSVSMLALYSIQVTSYKVQNSICIWKIVLLLYVVFKWYAYYCFHLQRIIGEGFIPTGKCTCNITEMMKSFTMPETLQGPQGPPGADGRTGSPGLTVSFFFNYVFFFQSFQLLYMNYR